MGQTQHFGATRADEAVKVPLSIYRRDNDTDDDDDDDDDDDVVVTILACLLLLSTG